MKKNILMMLLLAATTGVFAQEEEAPHEGMAITGHLTDVDDKEPIEQATIQMFRVKDSTFVGGTLSDLRGNFSVEAPSNGTYRLRISSIGYQTLEREVTIRRNQDVDLGTLLMSP